MQASTADDLSWRARAACRGIGPAWFFPEKGEPAAEAKAVCARCPVVEQCLDAAISSREATGIWGGLSERERRTVVRARRDDPTRRASA